MSGNNSSATATLTTSASASVAAADDEEEDSALTSDCELADMDLVNGPNPWLPAYGFQLQHHSHLQPTHLEDLRANGSYLIPISPPFPVILFFYFAAHVCNALGRRREKERGSGNL